MLQVSRPVETEFLVDFPLEDRFLKLPPSSYLNLLEITPNRPQYAMINAINDPQYRFVVACVSRRVGKTFISNIIAQLVALTPGTNVLLIAPDYNLASISWDLQRSLLDKFDVEREKDNSKDRIIELCNGSRIRCASVGRIDSAVGRSYDLIIFDESAIADEAGSKFNIALRPTLDKMNSKCIFISTPRGDNWFKEFFDRGFSAEETQWVSIHADYRENPRASLQDIEEAQRTMTTAEFEQEYLAKFVTFEGQVYSFGEHQILDLSELREKVTTGGARDRVDIIGGLDMGFRDETAMCVVVADFDVEKEETNYYIIDEYMAAEKTTAVYAENVARLENEYDLDVIYIDSANQQTRFDFAAMYDISTVNANKSKLDGIGRVGSLIQHDRLFVDESCVETIFSLRNYKWKLGTEREATEHTRASHMADAIRYAIYTHSISMGGL